MCILELNYTQGDDFEIDSYSFRYKHHVEKYSCMQNIVQYTCAIYVSTCLRNTLIIAPCIANTIQMINSISHNPTVSKLHIKC